MRIRRILALVATCVVLIGVGVAACFTRATWTPWIAALRQTKEEAEHEGGEPPLLEPKTLKLTAQGRKNLDLQAAPARPQTYVRTIQIPGTIVHRPGRTDRGVTSPAVGVVVGVHAFPGDTVSPGTKLFTLRLFSEYLQNTQTELFKATRETQLLNEQKARIEGLAQTGAVAGNRLIEIEQQLSRQAGLIQAYRQDLLTRGLAPDQIEKVETGQFVTTIDVVAPPPLASMSEPTPAIQPVALTSSESNGPLYEVQELSVELGQTVQAGQSLATLADHTSLFIEGHAFKSEATNLERAAQNGWPLRIEFAEDDAESWPAIEQIFAIRHLSNSVDEESRTFSFYVPLVNQSRSYQRDGERFVVWRFRPGQRVRLHVPVEEIPDVFVLPSGAVVRDGAEAYVFQQNGNLFDRLPVHVVHEDRTSVVVANDGSVKPGLFLAQGSAASLNRILKAQAASGVRADVHVHADGTVHAAH